MKKLVDDIQIKLTEVINNAKKKFSFDASIISVCTPYPYQDLIEKFGYTFKGFSFRPNLRSCLYKNPNSIVIQDKCGGTLNTVNFIDFYKDNEE